MTKKKSNKRKPKPNLVAAYCYAVYKRNPQAGLELARLNGSQRRTNDNDKPENQRQLSNPHVHGQAEAQR